MPGLTRLLSLRFRPIATVARKLLEFLSAHPQLKKILHNGYGFTGTVSTSLGPLPALVDFRNMLFFSFCYCLQRFSVQMPRICTTTEMTWTTGMICLFFCFRKSDWSPSSFRMESFASTLALFHSVSCFIVRTNVCFSKDPCQTSRA